MKQLTFSNGDTMAAIGLGTWKSKSSEVHNAVVEAIRAGYRHLDCAAAYGNEAEVGQAIREVINDGTITREDLWVTSKLWNSKHREEDVRPALEKTLNDLQLDYLDLYLMHWPVALRPDLTGYPQTADDFLSLEEVPLIETWQAMEQGMDDDLVRHLGVSNFSAKKIGELKQQAKHAPEMNQVEMHPLLQQPDLVDYCRREHVHLTAYSPLGSNDRPERLRKEDHVNLLKEETINRIADKHDCSPAQVLLKWGVERGTAVIPKSVNPKRIRENLAAADVPLDEEDMRHIQQLDRHARYVDGTLWVTENNSYSVETLWDE